MPSRIIHDDCLAALYEMDTASIDSIVTDPPYEIGLLGKKWDATGIAYSVELWQQALRVLKPGGHLLAFGGTRTYHRMACAIEDAGFEIRDSLHWHYGSGFPKSKNVGNGWGTALKPAHEPIVLARKPLIGTVAANILEHGTGAINVDGCRVGAGATAGRWPPNLLLTHSPACGDECAAGCPVAEMDAQSGTLKSPKTYTRGAPAEGEWLHRKESGTEQAGFGDSGGASRFFPGFRYVAKPSRRERDLGCESLAAKTAGEATDREEGSAGINPRAGAGRTGGARNHHPTVKPIALMEWLVTLVTPPGGTVLDPFAGSGTTGCAAARLGFNFIGIEREAEYIQIAELRIAASVRPVA